MTFVRQDVRQRFEAKVAARGDCLEWQSTLHRDGYGKFWLNGRQVQAHRAAWFVAHGELPAQMVLHRCHNRKCVNLDHLYLGDAKQNAKDRTVARRYYVRVPFATVQEIRRLYKEGGKSQQALGDMFGIDQTQVSKYIRNTQRIHT